MDNFPYRKYYLPSWQIMFSRLESLARYPPCPSDVFTRTFPGDYEYADGISNHFTEDVRILAKFGNNESPRTTWDSHPREGTPRELREDLFKEVKEANLFNAALAVYIYQAFRPDGCKRRMKLLDPSSGWGDRLIGAIACGDIDYHGYDPNHLLTEKYRSIITTLGGIGCSVQCERFETVELPNDFDMVVTSPPFFDLEVYLSPEDDVNQTQSSTLYPNIDSYLSDFYAPYLYRAFGALREGGIIVVYIENIGKVPLRDITATLLTGFGGTHLGTKHFTQLVEGTQTKPRPFLVYRK